MINMAEEEELVPEPLKSEVCEWLKSQVESAIRVVERTGRIEDPELFTGLIYYADRLMQHLKCVR